MILSYFLCLHCLIVIIETYCKNRGYYEQNVPFDDTKEEITLKEEDKEVETEDRNKFHLINRKKTVRNNAVTIEYEVKYNK